MSAEIVIKRCKDCTLGEQNHTRMINIVPLRTIVKSTIKRNCLNRLETIRNKRIVTFSAKCVKPDSYSPRE